MIERIRKSITVKDVVIETGDLMIFISGTLLNGTYGELSELEKQYAHKMAEIIPIYEQCCEIYEAKPPCKILQFQKKVENPSKEEPA